MIIHWQKWIARLTSLAMGAFGLVVASAQGADPALQAIAPYIQDTTVAVVQVDVAKVDVEGAFQAVRALIPEPLIPAAELTQRIEEMKAGQALLKQAGVTQIVAVVDMGSQPDFRPVLFASIEAGKTGEPVLTGVKQRMGLDYSEQAPGMVILGTEAAVKRLKAGTPAAREDLHAAFAATKPGAIRCAVGISGDTRRVLTELLPQLPPDIPLDAKKMASGFAWLSFSAQLDKSLGAQCCVESSNADAAGEFKKLFQLGKQRLEAEPGAPAEFKESLGALTAQQEGNSLKLAVNAESLAASQKMKAAIGGLLGKSRQAAQAAQSMNNMKQLMLAMHNYHDVYGHFPMASSIKKDGTRLLSWRVYVLPFIEQQALYQQFHLNEPWDSEHNKQLIAKMPKLFAAPTLSPAAVEKGMTTYVVPVGKGTMFSRDKGTRLQDVTDGTSNTAAILEANEKNAVIWTKPDDIDIDADGLIKKLQEGDGTIMIAFADGSVRRVKLTIAPNMLKFLLQMSDGNVVDIP